MRVLEYLCVCACNSFNCVLNFLFHCRAASGGRGSSSSRNSNSSAASSPLSSSATSCGSAACFVKASCKQRPPSLRRRRCGPSARASLLRTSLPLLLRLRLLLPARPVAALALLGSLQLSSVFKNNVSCCLLLVTCACCDARLKAKLKTETQIRITNHKTDNSKQRTQNREKF